MFSTLGFLAFSENDGNVDLALLNFEKVVQQTFKLAFVVYPTAVSQMPFPIFWSILFFIMLSTLGVGTQVGLFMACYESLLDKFKILKRNKLASLAFLVLLEFIVAYPMITRSGSAWLEVFDWSVCAVSIFIFGLLETIAVAWIYGIDNFISDAEEMLNYNLPLRNFWRYTWLFITPTVCSFIIFLNIYNYAVTGFKLSSSWPVSVNLTGWCIQLIQIVPIFVFIFLKMRPEDRKMKDSYFRNRDQQKGLMDDSSSE